MGFVVGVLTVIYFITCLVLIIVVLMQEPKGGGLSSAFGGAGLDTAFGASIGRKMSTFTVWLAVFFLILTIGLAILGKSDTTALSDDSVMKDIQKQVPAEQAEEEPVQKKESTKPPQAPGGEAGAKEDKSESVPEKPQEKKDTPEKAKEPASPEKKAESTEKSPESPDNTK